jgi:two-component system, NtrC family, nitrogen regulation sensor histidine kinase GlnL
MLHNRQAKNIEKLKYQHQVAVHMITAIMVLDPQLRIQYANPAAEALLVRSFKKLKNLLFDQVLSNTSLNHQRLQSLLASGQELTDSEIVLHLPSGPMITLEITASAIELEQGPHVLLELRQVDKQKQISAEAFQQQQWEAARDLIRGLAHEIKNPLGGLRGAAQLLTREISAEQQEYTAMIIEQADRLTNLVDRLLGPNQLPKLTTVNVHFVLEKIFKLLNYDNPKAIQLHRDYDPSIPDLEIDEDKLQQAVLNIVKNALQALPANGNITLQTRIASNQTINGKMFKMLIKICIIDDGPGIPLALQDKIFYPMISGRENGTGLGLSISQILINQHQGKLTCHSFPGRTEFIILLPIT